MGVKLKISGVDLKWKREMRTNQWKKRLFVETMIVGAMIVGAMIVVAMIVGAMIVGAMRLSFSTAQLCKNYTRAAYQKTLMPWNWDEYFKCLRKLGHFQQV